MKKITIVYILLIILIIILTWMYYPRIFKEQAWNLSENFVYGSYRKNESLNI